MVKLFLASIVLSVLSGFPIRPLWAAPLKPSVRYAPQPLAFEAWPNDSGRPLFFSREQGYSLLISPSSMELLLLYPDPSAPAREAGSGRPGIRHRFPPRKKGELLTLRLVGSNPSAGGRALEPLPGIKNYFLGPDPSRWRVKVPVAAKVEFSQVYPGIDLVYYGNQGKVEHDFIVHPGGDFHSIVWEVQGAGEITKGPEGSLILKGMGSEIRLASPECYEAYDGIRKALKGRYELNGGKVSFEVEGHDPDRLLVIDPVLFYSTYLGGSGTELGAGIAVDSSGNAFVTGLVDGPFPTTAGTFQTALSGIYDAYVTKLDATGGFLIYSTYLGGTDDAKGNAIAIDAAGNAYVAGDTKKGFPTTAGAAQTAISDTGTFGEAFVAKIDSTGSSLLYSTYLGGSLGTDTAFGIDVDSGGNAYVTGRTQGGFSVTAGAYQTVFGGGWTSYIAKLNSAGSALVYSTYLSGADAHAVSVDGSGNAYVTGQSPGGFPTTAGAYQTAYGGGIDAFLTKLNPAGSALVFSTYVGGAGGDGTWALALDGSGNCAIIGTSNGGYPTTAGAYQTTFGGINDAVITKVNSSGNALLFSTYLGGPSDDEGGGIGLDTSGNVLVSGYAEGGFPTTAAAFQPAFAGSSDAFVSKLDAAGGALLGSTYLGGPVYESSQGLAVDGSGYAYVTGYADLGFPTTAGAFQTVYGGGGAFGSDAFVAKLDLDETASTPTPTATATRTPSPTSSSTQAPGSSTPSFTPTLSATLTATPSRTASPTRTTSPTSTPTFIMTPTQAGSPTISPTFSVTPTFSPLRQFNLIAVYPNPMGSTGAKLLLELPYPSKVKVEIFNVKGEEVWAHDEAADTAGYKEIHWDCRNRDGKAVAFGVYYLVANLESTNSKRRATVGTWISIVR